MKITMEFDRNGDPKHKEIEVTDLKEAIAQAKTMVAQSDIYIDPDGNGKKYWSTVLKKLQELK